MLWFKTLPPGCAANHAAVCSCVFPVSVRWWRILCLSASVITSLLEAIFSYILITGGEWGLGVRIFKNILKCGVILNLYQKSGGDGQNILIGGVFLYCMILIPGFYCSIVICCN